MRTLILYGTKYGCTEKIAKTLSEKLKGEVEIFNLINNFDVSNLEKYDAIVIGGPVYVGMINKEVSLFASKHEDILKEKKLGLFISCMGDEDMVKTQLNKAFPDILLEKAVAIENFGGAFRLKKMKFMDRLITRFIAKTKHDKTNIIEKNIDRFVQLLQES
ncbi:flavodoxin domain-containing protein [Serpentinicella sp. ANB-PHB4]|uniref:flavodoxin domain-containing protein n=1 Tax=Serpentinicella sp. ANB-PHB4 TaxID=3074076 RepID=UPI002861ABDE|nr:flavodoxin domain-containing protein [Serpentinicella sp. ANB-PHB4]MDR5658955.1 flavodoxin domain-containing protein [Serpentinicella sp. ANB-PHB4]